MIRTQRYALIFVTLLFASFLTACQQNPTPTPAVTPVLDNTPEPTIRPTVRPTVDPSTIQSDFKWPPQLVYQSPLPGEETVLDGAITLRFDQPMNQDSVQNALTVSAPAEEGSAVQVVTGDFMWPRPDTLVFTPQESLARDAVYQVSLADSAAGENGVPLEETINFMVQTVGYLEVSQISPADGSQQVDPNSALTVLFNRPVVPLMASHEQDQLPSPVTITPQIEGKGEWVSTSIYRFTPTGGWNGATAYQVTVNSGLTDVTGGVLAAAVTTNFTTQSPLVLSTVPYPDQNQVIPTEPFYISFNMPMDVASTNAAVSINPAVPLEFGWDEAQTQLTITPTQRLELGTRYEINVASSAQASTGQAGLDQSYIIPFYTVPLPAVSYTYPADGETDIDPDSNYVSVEFASPMAWDTVTPTITIDPAPAEVTFDTYEGSYYLSIGFKMAYETKYTITIGGNAADPYGNTLGQDYVWSFTTGNARPYAFVNLPNYINHFSTSYPPTIDIIHRNKDKMQVALYSLPATAESFNYYYGEKPAGQDLLKSEVIQLSIRLNETVASDLNLDEFTGGRLPSGVYLLEVTHFDDQDELYSYPDNYILVVGDTNLVVKEMVDAVYVWATDIASGQPMPNLPLKLYGSEGQELGTAQTDTSGLAKFEYTPVYDYLQGVMVVSAQPNEPGFGLSASTWNQSITPWEFNLASDSSIESEHKGYIFTDRPLYRPGDTVYFRGYVRRSNYGRYDLPQMPQVNVTFDTGYAYTGMGEEASDAGQFNLTLNLDERGGFDGSFVLPAEFPVGSYGISVTNGDEWLTSVGVTVSEYRKPEFEVAVTSDKPEVVRGEASSVTIQANYFFGGPAANLPVTYRVFDNSYILSTNLPYRFSDDDYFWWWFDSFYGYGDEGYYGGALLEGTGTTDATGKLIVNLPADLLADSAEGSRQITVEATVMDVNNQIISGRTTMIHHAADGYVGVANNQYIVKVNEQTSVKLITVDWAGEPVGNRPVQVVFYKREWVENSETQAWEMKDTPVATENVISSAEGLSEVSFMAQEAGQYRVRGIYQDSSGRVQQSSEFFWVSGGSVLWPSDPQSRKMELVTDKTEYQVGETAEILVQSPFAGPIQAWLTIERGTLIEQKLITLTSNSDIVNVPIPAGYAPNVFVSIVAVKGIDNTNPYGDMRVGLAELVINPAPLLLNLTITPSQENYGPQDTAIFNLQLTNNSGQPIAADLSLALIDQALLTLQGDNATPIGQAFYANQPYRSQLGASLVFSAEGLEIDVERVEAEDDKADQALYEEEGIVMDAVGEVAPSEAPMAAMPTATAGFATRIDSGAAAPIEVRSDFQDTAYWQAVVTTDANGQATVEIPLPDNLTTWQLNVKAISAETLVGQGSSEITVSKPVLLRPITPRFFTVGDVLQLGTVVNNNTSSEQTLQVSLDAKGVEVTSPLSQEVTIPANGSAVVRWTVALKDLDVQFVDLTFIAQNQLYNDASKPTLGVGDEQLIPVYRYNAEDVVATSGVIAADGQRVEAILLPEGVDQTAGSFDIYVNASIASMILENLQVMESWPEYDRQCAHLLASHLLPNAVTARAINQLGLDEPEIKAELDKVIPEAIGRLAELQKSDGGYGWCYAPESSPWFTAYVLLALAKAEEAGYNVPINLINNATAYLQTQITTPERLESNRYEATQQAFMLYVLAEQGQAQMSDLDALFEESRALLGPDGQAFLLLAYKFTGGSPNMDTLKADLVGSAVLSATGAHWEGSYSYFGGDTYLTALVLYAQAQSGADEMIAPQTVRWLIKSREGLWWGGYYDSSWVLLALSEWMNVTGELKADYSFDITMNQTLAQTGSFTAENVSETVLVSTPADQLLTDEVNFVTFQKTGSGALYYNAYLDTFIPADLVPAVSRGITIERTYYEASCQPTPEQPCQPLTSIKAGQQVRVELTIIAHNNLTYAVVEDYFPAGGEAIDPALNTSAMTDTGIEPVYTRGYWGWWYFNRIQFQDDRVTFTASYLPAGTYQYSYTFQAVIPGLYQVRPTFGYQEFFPEVNGRAAGQVFVIEE